MRSLAALVCFLPAVAFAQAALFALPADVTAPPRSHGGVVDCAAHGVWHVPDGWSAGVLPSRDVVAVAPDGLALLARASTTGRRIRSAERFLEATTVLVARFADAPELDTPTEHVVNRWRVERSVEGTARVDGTEVRVHAESDGERELWITLAAGTEHDGVVRAAIDGWVMLTSHACLCGYDCDHRPEE